MGRRVFEDGADIRIDGVNGTREVKDGRADADNEIKVWNSNKTDWNYFDADRCKLAEPKCSPQAVCGEAQSHSNQSSDTGTAAMAKTTRSLVRVVLIDEDAGLDVSKALVKDFGTFVQEGSQEELIREVLMDTDQNVESALRAHNAVRAKEVDLDIRQRTGNEVKLQAVKLKDLTWKVTAA